MPVLMMTSVNTLYEVLVQDIKPVNQAGAPRIEATFHGLTQMELQRPPNSQPINDTATDPQSYITAFHEQEKYLSDAAHVAVNVFNPVKTQDIRFRATVKLSAVTGKLQPFSEQSTSSGLAYTLAIALKWGISKNLFDAQSLPDIPVFATGCVPIDCYIRPIGHLIKKIHYACDYIEKQIDAGEKIPKFIILIPAENSSEYKNQRDLKERVTNLGGSVIAINHASEAISLVMGEKFDGGIYTNTDNSFAGLNAISYEQRHLFMGRDDLVDNLYHKALEATKAKQVLNVIGISGSGKSSAVMAGLLPTLIKSNSIQIPELQFHPDFIIARPSQYSSLEALLNDLLSNYCNDKKLLQEWCQLKENPEKFSSAICDHLKATGITDSLKHIWVIDQYEEIFTHHDINNSSTLFSILSALAKKLPLLIVTVVRTEYINLLGSQSSCDFQLDRQVSPREVEQIISLQLQYHRLESEPALAHSQSEHPEQRQHLEIRIKNDAIGKPLTTISYLLQQMHDVMIDENSASTLLTHKHYESVGGIDGVMAKQAELAITNGLETIPEKQHSKIIDSFFSSLISIDDGHPTIVALPNQAIAHYPRGMDTLINAFMKKGLIIDCGKGATPKIKLAHDTLITDKKQQPHWSRLQEWFFHHKDYLSWKKKVIPSYNLWLSQPKESGNTFLLNEKQLLRQSFSTTIKNKQHNKKLALYLKASKQKHFKKAVIPPLVALCFLCSTSLLIWDQYFRVKTQYASFIGERYGIPFPVVQLDKKELKQRQFHYELHYKAGRLIYLSRYNSLGQLHNDADRGRAAQWQFYYTENGTLLRTDSFSKNGKKLNSERYQFTSTKNEARVNFRHQGTKTSIGNIIYQPARFEGYEKKRSQITQHQLIYNPQGLLEKRYFLNNNSVKIRDANGAYGIKYYYDNNNLVSRIEYIGRNNQAISIKGVYARKIERDKHGNIVSKSWLDTNDQLIWNSFGYAQNTLKYDKRGNIIETEFLEPNHELATTKDGYSRATVSYNESGLQTSQQFLDKDGLPAYNNIGVSRIEIAYDNRGNQIEWRYFDTQNQPALVDGKIFYMRFSYDENGNQTERSYYGKDNQLVSNSRGYAKLELRYDTHGNRVAASYFGIDNQLMNYRSTYATTTSKFDENGNRIERSFFDKNTKLTLNQYGYAKFAAQYDLRGNRTSIQFYGLDGGPINNIYGFSQLKTDYDQYGNPTQWAYFSTDGKPTLHHDGAAAVNADYDSQGNIIRVQYYGKNGQPILQRRGFALIQMDYDDQGNKTREQYLGVDQLPILQQDGYSERTISYDSRGNPIEWLYLDQSGEPVKNSKGYAKATAEYNRYNERIGTAYFDAENNFLNGEGSLKQ